MLHRTVKQVAAAFDCEAEAEVEIEIFSGYPVLYNDPDMTDIALEVGKEYLGDENVHHSEKLMTAEDFAYYLRECAGSFWQLGTGLDGSAPGNLLHSPTFDS